MCASYLSYCKSWYVWFCKCFVHMLFLCRGATHNHTQSYTVQVFGNRSVDVIAEHNPTNARWYVLVGVVRTCLVLYTFYSFFRPQEITINLTSWGVLGVTPAKATRARWVIWCISCNALSHLSRSNHHHAQDILSSSFWWPSTDNKNPR